MFRCKIIQKKIQHFDFLAVSLYLAVVTIPLGNNLNSRTLILFCVLGIFKNNIRDKKNLLTRILIWILLVLLFIVVLASLIWDPNGIGALKSIEKKVSFLILPIILASIPQVSKRVVKTTFFVFILSILF